MKRLILIRHAKATHESGYADFDRPLKQSGMQDALFMANILKERALIPEIVITSPALRTLTTAQIFAEHLHLPPSDTDEKIYEANERTLINIINNLPNEYDFIALVGHNPGISQILYYLTGQMRDVPTCAVALISFDNDDWRSISNEDGHLAFYDSPKG
ncbi:histidine phosphatase family protein [Mucilaginibacter sabulilitoris]|uniref:Histidine phosphatase family protein n=1 Tax=Mucilaginibacter sabulilitoris TaxID=1173583 RepID=A0ABZ0TLD3_9SPHI|nr:histidine phosphatase family protein [Mucilaginibacter sabulilitoris]WPU92539.1 histidine phosphatase family protein [Mucilaginibacter sabulilitoris]